MKLTYEVDRCGTKTYRNAEGKLHRLDGPAFEYAGGAKHWYRNGLRHRTDGPAAEHADGSKYWYQNDKLHRTGRPAIEYANGDRVWYVNDKQHRTDGPAFEYADGWKYWYLNGEQLTEMQFNERTKPVVEAVKAKLQTIDIDGVTYKLVKA